MEKEKKYTVPGAPLEEETSVKIRQALQTVDISSLAHISEVRDANKMNNKEEDVLLDAHSLFLQYIPLTIYDIAQR